MRDILTIIPEFFKGIQRNAYLIAVNCPDNPETIQAIVDAGAAAGAGTVGDYDRVAMIVRGEETYVSGLNSHPTVGTPGEMTVEPSVRITMQAPRRRLRAAVEAIAGAHPYEEPVIEVTKLERRGLVASAIRKTAREKAGYR